ncbi:hypothetical protein R69746_06330 [Paraburkholderia aspalathi]|nr:hypothetical protein R69746_06330 [Paraburkholderia aspalathi]CAE6832526.1 hypothetical protein R75465_06341 [Paraburkholderia aspalathi]
MHARRANASPRRAGLKLKRSRRRSAPVSKKHAIPLSINCWKILEKGG